jgi:cytochrome c553
MKITRRLCYSFISAILVFVAAPAVAVEPIRVVLEFVPDLDNGRRTFDICARCHLPEAWGNSDGTYPQLAGQHVNVLMKQLLDIRSGRRVNPAMQPFVQERTIGGYQNLSDVVAYISTLPMNPEHAKGPWPPESRQYREGAELYQQYCAGCHGETGQGNNELSYPRLQGQHYDYMLRQASLVRRNLRKVKPSMASLMETLSIDQFDSVLNYVSYLPVPPADLAPDAQWRNPDFQ